MDLSIIIVNYKSEGYLVNCLNSVYNNYQSSDLLKYEFEVIVVDNSPRGEEADKVAEDILKIFPKVNWIKMATNVGFARANNAGIKQCSGDVILLLNPDTFVIKHSITNCYAKFIKSDYVACGVQLLNDDLSNQFSGSNFVKGGVNFFLNLPYVGSAIKRMAKKVGLKKPGVEETKEVTEVDWVCGAFLMVKRSAAAEVGLLDEDFFLYAEEAEWCNRLGAVGKLCLYGGDHNVIHTMGVTTNSFYKREKQIFDKKDAQIMLSNLALIRKSQGVLWLFIHMFFYTLSAPFIFLISIFKGGIKNSINYLQGLAKAYTFIPKLITNQKTFYKI